MHKCLLTATITQVNRFRFLVVNAFPRPRFSCTSLFPRCDHGVRQNNSPLIIDCVYENKWQHMTAASLTPTGLP